MPAFVEGPLESFFFSSLSSLPHFVNFLQFFWGLFWEETESSKMFISLEPQVS